MEHRIKFKATRTHVPHKGLLAGIGLVSAAVLGGVGYMAGKNQERASWTQRVSNNTTLLNSRGF